MSRKKLQSKKYDQECAVKSQIKEAALGTISARNISLIP